MPRSMRKFTRYGETQTTTCVICQRPATMKNQQGLPSCIHHRTLSLSDLRCVCGKDLEVREGKFGTFFLCLVCGPQSIRRILELRGPERAPVKPVEETATGTSNQRRGKRNPLVVVGKISMMSLRNSSVAMIPSTSVSLLSITWSAMMLLKDVSPSRVRSGCPD
jgi:hypothetical protein